MTFANVDLDPILTHVGTENSEILTIEAKCGTTNVRVVNG